MEERWISKFYQFQLLSCIASGRLLTCFVSVASNFSPINVIHACGWVDEGGIEKDHYLITLKMLKNGHWKSTLATNVLWYE